MTEMTMVILLLMVGGSFVVALKQSMDIRKLQKEANDYSWKIKKANDSLAEMEGKLASAYIDIATYKTGADKVTFGIINKYSDDELVELANFGRAMEIVVKVVMYFAAVKADSLRVPDNQKTPQDVMRCVGESNSAHELLLFFHKIKESASPQK